ncbi:MAG: histidinol-phosphatase HisJ family protein [Gudongella sp.]|jgi:histidinol-phosphatase (PHP family)|nr:histidinol-phosphatase HisJ family protein [Gudongella sp.]
MYDFHIHSDFSIDSKTPMEKIALAAIDKNLRAICFTDHVDFEATADKIDLMFRPLDYFRDINRVKYKYRDKIEILAGVEIGMQPHLTERYQKFISDYGFDFVIMSIHSIDGKDIFFDFNDMDISADEILLKYYNSVLDSVKSFDDFDVLGHLDFIDRYLLIRQENFRYDAVMDVIKNILMILIEKGKGLEVNTGGLRYGLSWFHPKTQILKLYKDLGGEIITFGSDTHSELHVGFEYKNVERLLRELEFKYIYIFRGRKKFPIQIA